MITIVLDGRYLVMAGAILNLIVAATMLFIVGISIMW